MSTLSHKLAVILAAAYFTALATILFWPTTVDKPVRGTLDQILDWLYAHGVPEWLINYNVVEFSANIALFVPFGIILALRLHRRYWWISVPISAATSALVELAQGLLLPGRVPALSDVVANTAGALLGALLVLRLWAWRRKRALHAVSSTSSTVP